MKTTIEAEEFFRKKSFPNGIPDEEWEKWKITHKGTNWQGFSINAMVEFAELYHTRKCEESGRELITDDEIKTECEIRAKGQRLFAIREREYKWMMKGAKFVKNKMLLLLASFQSQLEAKDKEIVFAKEDKQALGRTIDEVYRPRIIELESQLQEAKAEAKHSEEMRNLCAEQCEHKNKLILEICKERDEFKAEVERFSQFKKWIDEMIEKEEKGGDLSYRQHRVVYTQVKEKISQLNQHKTEGK